MTTDKLEMVSADPRVLQGQAVIAGTRLPVLDPVPASRPAGHRVAASRDSRLRVGQLTFDHVKVSGISAWSRAGAFQMLRW